MILNDKYFNYCVNIRRELHKIPETGFELEKTVSLIKKELDKLNISYVSEVGISSIVATINGSSTKEIGFRADIDALFLNEENDLDFKSTHAGKMHACGHDTHAAMLLTTLKYFVEEKITPPVTIKAIFQAAEEGPSSGGALVVQDKSIENVESFFALHVSPELETGYFESRAYEFNASCSDFVIELFGFSGHAAYPHTSIDAIQMGVEVYNLIQNMKTRELEQAEKTVISITNITSGSNSNNVVPDKLYMHGTVRTYNDELKMLIGEKMENILKCVTTLHNGSYKFKYSKDCIALINDPLLYNYVKQISEKIKPNVFREMKKYVMGVDDFAYYCKKSRGIMINLGIRNESIGSVYPLHNNKFIVDEEAFRNGVSLLILIILNYQDSL